MEIKEILLFLLAAVGGLLAVPLLLVAMMAGLVLLAAAWPLILAGLMIWSGLFPFNPYIIAGAGVGTEITWLICVALDEAKERHY